jgi:transcription elongation factor GreA
MSVDRVWMTSSTLQRLEQELAQLSEAAEQGRGQEGDAARIRELRDLVSRAETDEKPDDGLVEPGMQITVSFGPDDTMTFLFGSRELLGRDSGVDLEVYSPTSPLGVAINGRYVGDAVTYQAPNGPVEVTIVAAAPFR